MDTNLLDYIRVLSERDTKTLSQKALKTVEEVGELAKKVLPYEGAFATNHRMISREDIIEEVADVMLCALSIAYNLYASDAEIAAKMSEKSVKWSDLQARESGGKFPLPYEIHVTVDLKTSEAYTQDTSQIAVIDTFRAACGEISVKPIILDLQNVVGLSVMTDVMTSSKHFGTNTSALAYAKDVAAKLKDRGFNVIRVKIESVPWHPAAPQGPLHEMPQDCYFESHIPVQLYPTHRDALVACIADKELNVHISRNAFKCLSDGREVVMLTYRLYKGYANQFNEEVDEIVRTLKDVGFDIGKVHTEFAVYDTKVSHDASWLK